MPSNKRRRARRAKGIECYVIVKIGEGERSFLVTARSNKHAGALVAQQLLDEGITWSKMRLAEVV